MAHEAELGLFARALAEQPRLGVGGRGVSIVAPPLAMEVPAAVAAAGWRLVGAVLRAEALDRCSGLDQGAVDREVLATQELSDPRVVEDRRQELGRDLALEQPVAVGRERGRMPDRIADPEPHEPAEQKIVVQLDTSKNLGRTGLI